MIVAPIAVDVSLPMVSIIVPAFNEERLIRTTLDAIAAIDYPPAKLEVVVVDNGSTDGTSEVARSCGARVLIRPGVSVAALRNAGTAAASGAVLAFLDADCVPARDWLMNAVRSLHEGAGVTGCRVAVPEGGTWVERAWFGLPPVGRREVPYINSGNLIVDRKVFEQVGGFDETLVSGEDSDFCRRATAIAAIVADDRIQAVHLGNPKTLGQFLRREIWHGMGGLGATALTVKNKPLLGALALLGLSALQLIGLAIWLAGRGPALLLVATVSVAGLVMTSAVHRARSLRRPGLILQQGLLYYLYFVGRAIAVGRLWFRIDHPGRLR
jgi:Glycosyl transferase family 2